MVAGTTAVAARSALITILRARPGLAGVSAFSAEPKSWPDRSIRMVAIESGVVDVAALRAAGQRARVEETYRLTGVIVVRQAPGPDAELHAEMAAADIYGEILDEVARDPRLGDVPGVQWARMAGFTMNAVFQQGNSQYAVLDFSVEVTARP